MSQLGLDNNDCTMSDIFTKMIQDNDSVLYLNVSNNIVVTDLPINSSGELFIVQSQKGRNFALYTENYAASTNNQRMWFGVFAWSPVSFQGWHQILANQNPCAEWALQDGYIAQLDRSGSNWQDLCIKLIKDDSTVYMPLIQNLKRSYALSSELPPINIYHKLISLGFSDAVSLEDIYNKLPEHSYFFCSTEGADTITNLPDNATYGILEIYRSGRNFARFTPSLSTGTSDSMYYGTFTWSGSVKFNGWRRIIGTERLANNLTTTATEYALDARQGKALNDKITSMQSSFQAGVDTLYNKCVSCGSTPSSKTPTDISNAIQSIYTNRYNAGVSATKKGNATAGNVLSGKTFTSTAGVNLTGTMPNRGNLNWSASNTAKTVSAGYYSGGTLDSRPSYAAGYNAGYNNGKVEGKPVTFLDSKLTRSSGEWLKYTYTVTEDCYILVIIGAFGYNNLVLQKNNINVEPTAKIDNQYEVQTHLYTYSLQCNKNDVLFADSEPGSYNSRSTICMIFKT